MLQDDMLCISRLCDSKHAQRASLGAVSWLRQTPNQWLAKETAKALLPCTPLQQLPTACCAGDARAGR